MEENNKATPLHEEQEVAKFRLDISSEYVLIVYRNLAKHWWWEGLDIKATVDQDRSNPNKYILNQTIESGEYNLIDSSNKPYELGYLEVIPVGEEPKPVDIRVVCSWGVVLSFWKELGVVLEREFSVIPIEKDLVPEQPQENEPSIDIHIPKRPLTLIKWKRVWFEWNSKLNYFPDYEKFGDWLNKMHPDLPNSPDTLSKIIRAGNARLLDDVDNPNN